MLYYQNVFPNKVRIIAKQKLYPCPSGWAPGLRIVETIATSIENSGNNSGTVDGFPYV